VTVIVMMKITIADAIMTAAIAVDRQENQGN